jgi:hypothetical protein
MNQNEADPTGAFRGGSAGLESEETGTEYERHAPDGADPGGGLPNTGRDETGGVDSGEREVITSGTAATSEIGDPEAQADAERQGDGTPRPA